MSRTSQTLSLPNAQVALTAFTAFTLFLPSHMKAQDPGIDPGFGVGAMFGLFLLGGNDFDGTDTGPGVNGFLRYNFPSGFSLTGGVQYNNHPVDGVANNLNVLGVVIDPRYYFRLPSAPSLAPFIGARAAWLHESIGVSGFDFIATGWAFGAVGGLLIKASQQLAFEAGLSVAAVSFGDFRVDGSSLPDTDGSGSSVAFLAGIVLTFPSQ